LDIVTVHRVADFNFFRFFQVKVVGPIILKSVFDIYLKTIEYHYGVCCMKYVKNCL